MKLWDHRAPAHELFLEACGLDIPGSPKIYGVCEESGLVIYISEFKAEYEILQNLLKSDGEYWLTSPTMMNILNQAIETFEALRLYRFVYTDFCTKNIFVHPATSDILFIDLDSALSYENLADTILMKQAINDFDNNLWSVWLQYVVPHRGFDTSPAVLRRTMVLSFAAVWGRALGLLKGPQPSPEDPFALVAEPILPKQEPLWEALRTGSAAGFQEYFRLSQPVRNLFELWQGIFQELCDGHHVSWEDVRQAADLIARANWIPSRKRISSPVRPNWEIPHISWRTVGKNIYDPFRVITLTTKLVRSRSTS